MDKSERPHDAPEEIPPNHTIFLSYRSAKLVVDMIKVGKEAGALRATDPEQECFLPRADIRGDKEAILVAMKGVVTDFARETRDNPALRAAVINEAMRRAADERSQHTEVVFAEHRHSIVRAMLREVGIPLREKLSREQKTSELQRAFYTCAIDSLASAATQADQAIRRIDYVPEKNPGENSIFYARHVGSRLFDRLRYRANEAGSLKARLSREPIMEVQGDEGALSAACREELDQFMRSFEKNRALRGVILHILKGYVESWEKYFRPKPPARGFREALISAVDTVLCPGQRKFDAFNNANRAVSQRFFAIILEEVESCIQKQNSGT